jgi:hypothetical protein
VRSVVERIVLLAVVSGTALLAPALADADGRVLARRATIPCFSERVDRYVAKVHPERCDLVGRREIGSLVHFPIRGIRWENWGAPRSFGTGGVDPFIGHRMRVMAFARVKCGGGVRYSEANVVDTRTGANVVVRLPRCA